MKHSCVLTVKNGTKLFKIENIADLGGLAMAYKAYQKSLEGKTKPPSIEVSRRSKDFS